MSTTLGVVFPAHGLDDPRHLCWFTNPVTGVLHYKKLGQPIDLWLRPLLPFPRKARLAVRFPDVMGRLSGSPFPRPRYLAPHEADRLVRWLDRQPRHRQPRIITTVPSSAVRVAVAAREAGVDLRGVTFSVQSEPVTDARYREMTASGARVLVGYGSMEAPGFSFSCAAPRAADDVHLCTDLYAIGRRERPVSDGGPTVGGADAASLRAVLLEALAAGGIVDQNHAELLRRARSVTIGRLPPLATGAGKVLPFHLLGRSGRREADRRADPTAGMSDDATLC